MAGKANMELMNALHGALAEYYKEYLEEANANGEEVSSGFLTAVNAFLKNNDITVDIVESNSMNDLGLKIKDILHKHKEEV